MTIARSRITAQGQISVPVEVRRKLGVGAGAVLEWDEADDHLIVRRAGRYTSRNIHEALFGEKAPAVKTLSELKEGVRRKTRSRHARR